MYVVLACLTGCSAFNSPFNTASYESSNTAQVNQSVDYQTTDDSPHAITQYMDDLKVAGGNQSDQSAPEKYKRQN
jgi:hypothetical protein